MVKKVDALVKLSNSGAFKTSKYKNKVKIVIDQFRETRAWVEVEMIEPVMKGFLDYAEQFLSIGEEICLAKGLGSAWHRSLKRST